MISILLIILPVVFGLLVLAGPVKGTGRLSTILSLATMFIALYGYSSFKSQGAADFNVDMEWIKNPSVHIKFTVDGIALLMLIMVNICIPFIHLSADKRELNQPRIFHFLIFMMQAALAGVFLADDLVLYYIFWELTIIPAYFMLIYWGGKNRRNITFKFFLYTVFGSLFMMVSILYLYAQYANGMSINSQSIYGMNVPVGAQQWLFAGFLLAFAVKLPLIPFHTWQANTYHMAPNQATMILSGLLAKMALFAMVRWMIPALPVATQTHAPLLMVASVGGVIYAGIIAIMQKDIKKMLAYVSLAHISLMVAGIFSLNIVGMQGAFTQAFSHGLNTVALFICVDIIQSRLGTTDLTKMGGLRKQAPKFATAFFIIMFATAAIPFSNSFIGEVVTLYGVFTYSAIYAVIAAFSLVLGAVFMLRMFRQAVLGPENAQTAGFKDICGTETASLIPFVLLIFVFGVVYQPVFDLVVQPLQSILNNFVDYNIVAPDTTLPDL